MNSPSAAPRSRDCPPVTAAVVRARSRVNPASRRARRPNGAGKTTTCDASGSCRSPVRCFSNEVAVAVVQARVARVGFVTEERSCSCALHRRQPPPRPPARRRHRTVPRARAADAAERRLSGREQRMLALARVASKPTMLLPTASSASPHWWSGGCSGRARRRGRRGLGVLLVERRSPSVADRRSCLRPARGEMRSRTAAEVHGRLTSERLPRRYGQVRDQALYALINAAWKGV